METKRLALGADPPDVLGYTAASELPIVKSSMKPHTSNHAVKKRERT